MPNYAPPLKKSAVDIHFMTSEAAVKVKKAQGQADCMVALKETFSLRRHLITRTRGRKELSSMKEMFPPMFTEDAVSRTECM